MMVSGSIRMKQTLKPVNSSQPLVVLGFSSPDQRHQLLIFDSVWGASKEWAGSAQIGKLLCSRTLRGITTQGYSSPTPDFVP